MNYYVSMFHPVLYSFLPVHRLSLQVDVPTRDVETRSKTCSLKCLHGQCSYYFNSDKYFCQCTNGYSGLLCTVKNVYCCSSYSICVGVVDNRSICIRPVGKFGPRCFFLNKTGCNANLCSDNDRCIAGDEKYFTMDYFCLCLQGFTDSKCGNRERKIEFHCLEPIFLPQEIFIHFVHISSKHDPSYELSGDGVTQTTMISKIKYQETSTSVYYAGELHLIFLEFRQ
ncbi:unnamed protein product [Rotaria magnacalcarata]|uniref:EGF-like domain-containing protein n=2 Tax=Rotaria magnacalcarata TaxID=392030 RepID=A0A816KJY5_9BILA|nr:unnamed protein product [Rotaria magnacalcarata]CAF1920193.1 unnamed protein product [Rotaria magnacalcarata]